MKNKNIIIGTAWKYAVPQLRFFVESWKNHCHNTRLVLVVNNDIDMDTVHWLKDNKVEILSFTAGYYTPIEIQHSRYFRYLDFLVEEYLRTLDQNIKVFLTDVRDVVFQGNIFSTVSSPGLHVFSEDSKATCGNTDFNRYMLTVNYGEEVAEELKNHPVICSGTTLGTISSVIRYIQVLIEQRDLNKVMQGWMEGKFDMQNTIGLDQGMHIYIVHKNLVENVIHENGDGVGTLACTSKEDIQILPNKKVSVYGKVPAVIHQWDRHQELIDFYNQ